MKIIVEHQPKLLRRTQKHILFRIYSFPKNKKEHTQTNDLSVSTYGYFLEAVWTILMQLHADTSFLREMHPRVYNKSTMLKVQLQLQNKVAW